MRPVAVLLLVLAACGGGGAAPDAGGADSGSGDAPADAPADVPADPAACGCQVDGTGTLTLSWACYCTQSFVACDTLLAVPTNCATYTRTDYPECGLTTLVNGVGASAGLPSVYDATGKLVGRASASDLTLFACPSDPSLGGYFERSGLFPASSCRAVACGGCYAGPFPCPGPDGGSGSSDATPPADAAADASGADGSGAD
jgi:hypothetical protein